MGYIGQAPANKVVTSADIEDGVVSAADLAANSVDSSELVDLSIDTSHIGALQVTTAKLAADAVDGTKIADDAIESEHYANTSIDTAHIGALQVTGAKLNTDAISAQTELAVAPADADEFMVSDGGVLKRIDYSLIKGSSHFVRTGYMDSTGSASVSMTDCFSSAYSNYVIYLAATNNATDATFLKLRFLDASDAVQTNNRNWSMIYTVANGTTPTVVTIGEDTASDDFIRLSVGDDINSANTFIITMTRWTDGGPEAQIKWDCASESWTGQKSQNIMGAARWDSGNTYGVNFVNAAGTNITVQGACYGIKYD